MKKKLTLLFLIFLYKISVAQINVIYSTANDNQLWQVVKKNNGNYLVVINEANRIQRPIVGHSKIIEMNPKGIFVDSTIMESNTQDLFIDRLIPVSDGYIGLGQINNRIDSHPFFWVFRLNKQLQRVQDTTISIKEGLVIPSFAFDKDSNIIFSCGDGTKFIYFGKINKNRYPHILED